MVENNTGNIPGKKSEIDSRARNQRDLYVKKVLPDINRTAKRVWRDTSDIASEDIAQETVVNLFTRKRVKEPQLEIPYAVQATKHTAIDEGRKRAKQVTFPRDN